jgi:hypothetical protein
MSAILQDPIFKTVGQALYIVYAMEVTAVSNKGATQVAIENMMEDRYGEIKDERERQINMGTMTAFELRGQCAVVRRWVEDLLPGPERNVVYARYGQRSINDRGQIVLDRRAMGCRGLAQQLFSICQTQNEEAAYALIFGLFASGAGRRRAEFSLRRIERELGPSKSALHRDQGLLKMQCNTLEVRATTRLEEHFMRKGVIPDPAHA